MSRYGVPFSKGPEVHLAPHPESCDLSDVSLYAHRCAGPLAIDLFSGAGGLSLGLKMAGFNVVLAAELEQEAAATHRAHFGGSSLCADLSSQETVDAICAALDGVELDLVAGGPPCQPYSQAAFSKVRHLEAFHGRQPDQRRNLWSSYVQIVMRTRPRAVLVENVPDMAFGRDGVVLRRLVAALEGIGYHVHTRVLTSDSFGVPQHRQRLFTVAFREPREFHWPSREDHVRRVLRDAIGDLPEVAGGDRREVRPYSGNPSPLQEFFRESVRGEDAHVIYDHYARAVRPDDLEAFKLMTSKTRYSDLPDHLKRYRDDIFEDKYKRLDMEQLSRTITAHISKDGYWYIHPTQHRTLTVREAARIQTFPDSYRFCGYPRHAFKQIGEAVPPLLGKAIGSSILEALTKNKNSSTLSTKATVDLVAEWFSALDQESMVMPWMKATSLWGILVGVLLLDRSAKSNAAILFKEALERWKTPGEFLADTEANDFAAARFKFENFECLRRLAQRISAGECITAEVLSECGVPQAQALRILASTGCGTRRPLNAALERLTRRYTGMPARVEDGRGNTEMLFGRMVGVDNAGVIYRAMSEVAASFCQPASPTCANCPLSVSCARYRCDSGSEAESNLPKGALTSLAKKVKRPMARFQELPPSAGSLALSLRDLGYSLETRGHHRQQHHCRSDES